MFKRFFKKSWVRIVAIILAVCACGGLVYGGVNLFSDEKTKTVYTNWNIGSLDTLGKYHKDEGSIYTKNLIEALGLEVEPDFNADITFKVFYYDSDENFLFATNEQSDNYTNSATYPKYARIVVTPKEDDSINVFEVVKYASKVTIKNYKNQNYKFDDDLYVLDNELKALGKYYGTTTLAVSGYSTNPDTNNNVIVASTKVGCSGAKTVAVVTSTYFTCSFAKDDLSIVSMSTYQVTAGQTSSNIYRVETYGSNYKVVYLTVPATATQFVVQTVSGNALKVYLID